MVTKLSRSCNSVTAMAKLLEVSVEHLQRQSQTLDKSAFLKLISVIADLLTALNGKNTFLADVLLKYLDEAKDSSGILCAKTSAEWLIHLVAELVSTGCIPILKLITIFILPILAKLNKDPKVCSFN
jgi:cell division protein ZapA (FtsZ GTPase activity inhibitor)